MFRLIALPIIGSMKAFETMLLEKISTKIINGYVIR